ncbi:ATP-dependent caseinolytic protease/crotonase family protein [Parasponia andersonii]|uniref:ATP-dependent caseinolytic protease/crotonase family protein n=1 Tax=Parasponia andersonii TaxID=3476 RepID=A0A2P5CUC5_PARAD|nr:ATP-dependent caseinolytic protease/crotonase family protein [Parasponia andersonii]
MELSKPHLQSSEFSLPNASDSQTLGPSNSLSLPSEPPELGNWFPSYQYESPVLETNDNFGDSVYEESEIGKDEVLIGKEESLGGSKEILKKDDQVLVGVKLNSNKFSECRHSFGDDEGENPSSSQIVDSAFSASLPSEPINVRNWFSSYVYESPTLDTIDGFRDSRSEDSECEEDGFVVEESNREKAEAYGELRGTRSDDAENSYGRGNYDKTCEINKQKKQPSNKDDPRCGGSGQILSSKSNTCVGIALKQCSKYETLQNQGISPAKDVEFPNLDQEDTQVKLNFSDEIRIAALKVHGSLCRRDGGESSEKLIHTMGNVKDSKAKGHMEAASFLSPESNLKSFLAKGATIEKPTHGCDDKENDGTEISKDGFVTTRKGRLTMLTLVEIPKQNRKGTVSLAGGKGCAVERKPLAERTNFHHSRLTEITGKWQCPQKRKPNLGPPLKQLRLERWVHRV